MTILYTDRRNTHRIDADTQAPLVLDIVNRYLLIETWFDICHIDLRGDIESVELYHVFDQRRVASLGGAAAWKVYEELARNFPEINHHFRMPAATPPTA